MTSSSQQIVTSPGQKLETPIGLLDNQIIADTDNSRTKRQKLSDLGGMNNSQVGVRVAARGPSTCPSSTLPPSDGTHYPYPTY